MRRWSCWSRDRHADGGAGRAQKPDAAERQRYMAKALLPIIDGGGGAFLALRDASLAGICISGARCGVISRRGLSRERSCGRLYAAESVKKA